MGNNENESELSEQKIETEEKNHKKSNMSFDGIIGSINVVIVFIVAIIGAACYIITTFAEIKLDISSINNNISSITGKVENLEKDIENMNDEISSIKDYLYGNHGVESQLEDINKVLNIVPISASNEITSSLEKVSISHTFSSSPENNINDTTRVGTDINGNIHLAEELINETILLTYLEKNDDGDDVEVYFLGQYNENYHWNGFCVTNAFYMDGTLYSICESNFKDGERLDFKSIVYQPNDADWLYSDRKIITKRVANEEKVINEGKNIHYSFEYNKIKNFTNFNVRVSDIMHVDNFLENVNPIMTKYYSGNTSDGYYNDESGNAYKITYFKNGTVKSMYVGKFIDGYPNDNTGNAWEIFYSEEDGSYVVRKGTFVNGEYIDSSNNLPYQSPIDNEENKNDSSNNLPYQSPIDNEENKNDSSNNLPYPHPIDNEEINKTIIENGIEDIMDFELID